MTKFILKKKNSPITIPSLSGLLNFQKSGDQDGFIGDFSAKTSLPTEVYQIKVKTEPGGGLFEASVNHDVQKNVFDTKVCQNSTKFN